VFDEDKNSILGGNLDTAIRVARMVQRSTISSSSSPSMTGKVIVPQLPLHLVPMDWRKTPGKGLSDRSNMWKKKALSSFREESGPHKPRSRSSRPIDLCIPFSPKKVEDERKAATERNLRSKVTPRVFAMSPFTEFENIRRKMTDDALTDIFITQERDIELLADEERNRRVMSSRSRLSKKPSPEKIYKSNVHEIAKLSFSLDEHRQWLHHQLEGSSGEDMSGTVTDALATTVHEGCDGGVAPKTPRPPKPPRRLGELRTSRKGDLHAQVVDRLERLRYDVTLQRELAEKCREYRRKDMKERKETEDSKWKLVKENVVTAKSFSRSKKIESIRKCAVLLQERHKKAIERHDTIQKEREDDKRRQLERTQTRLKKIEVSFFFFFFLHIFFKIKSQFLFISLLILRVSCAFRCEGDVTFGLFEAAESKEAVGCDHCCRITTVKTD
jgi:hypothetical protein